MKQYSNRFAVVVLICLKEIIFYILSLLNFLCLKYMNFLFSTVGCNIAANGYVYGVGWRFKARNCQTATKSIKCTALKISTIRQLHYTRCYKLAVFVFCYSIFHFCCIVLLSVHWGRQALLQVLIVCRMVRPANVLDYEALTIIKNILLHHFSQYQVILKTYKSDQYQILHQELNCIFHLSRFFAYQYFLQLLCLKD